MLIDKVKNHAVISSMLLLFVLIVSVCAFYSYQHTMVKPKRLLNHLILVASKQASLSADDYNMVRLKEQSRLWILDHLNQDLMHTNLPDSETAGIYLQTQASQFLNDDETFHQWLNQWLQAIYEQADGHIIRDMVLENGNVLQIGNWCLSIASSRLHWRLESVTQCSQQGVNP